MIVLSLFDGCSGGQQAFERQGIKVDTYYASEIDKHAIKITQKNYPNTIQLGSVVNVDVSKLGWIDVLIGGSPCQSFSFAGKRKGMSTKEIPNFSAPSVKEWEEYLLEENSIYLEYSEYCDKLYERHERKYASLNKEIIEILSLTQYLELKEQGFEFEGQSYLFWEYMRVLTDIRKINPDVKFLLENVLMGEKWEKVLSRAIGVNPIEINSASVSAQNRRRLYWTNIGMKPAGLFGDLESIIQQPKDRWILLKHILESEVDEKYFLSDKMLAYLVRHKAIHEEKGTGFGFEPTEGNKKANCLRANPALAPTDNIIIDTSTKARCFTAGGNSGGLHSQMDLIYDNKRIRRLTPTECERLQTVKDGYTEGVSDTQRYRMLGNGWTIEVISHILSYYE